MLLKLLERLYKSRIRKVIASALAAIVISSDDESVSAVREKVKDAIQDQHKVPGDLRRYACWQVDQVKASTVVDLLTKVGRVAAVLVVLFAGLAASAIAQRLPVAITAPATLGAGQTGTVTVAICNTNPMAKTETTPAMSLVTLTYLDANTAKTASAEAAISITRTVGGEPWVSPSAIVTLPSPLQFDVGTVRFAGAPDAAFRVMPDGGLSLTASSLPAGATWTTTATIRNP